MRLIEQNIYFERYRRKKQLSIHHAAFEGFALALILSYLPNARFLSYLGPFIVAGWLLIRTQSSALLRKIFLGIGLYTLFVAFCSIYYTLKGVEYHFFNSILALLTYSPFFIAFSTENGNTLAHEKTDLKKYERFIGFFLLFQGLIGIFQFSIIRFGFMSTGIIPEDGVQGTMGLLRFLGSPVDTGFGNQMYAILSFMLLVFYIPIALKLKKGYLNILVSFFSLLLASVLHVFISFVLALLTVSLLFFLPVIGKRIKELIFLCMLVGLSFYTAQSIFPGIEGTANVFFEFLITKGDSPKNKAVTDAIIEMPQEIHEIWIFGLGPGQFSSRAGLIGTGEYFRAELPFISRTPTSAYERFGYTHWDTYRKHNGIYGNSTMHRPFFSMLSLFTEIGALGIGVIFLMMMVYLMKKASKFHYFLNRKQSLYANLAFGNGIMVLFLFYIAFFENYLEASQAIFPGLLLLRYSDSLLKAKESNIYPKK